MEAVKMMGQILETDALGYCQWSQRNRKNLVAEFSKRAGKK